MKTKKNKKFYNFTEYQKRKDRSLNYRHFSCVPSYFRRVFNDSEKAKEKIILHRILKGEEIEFPKRVKDVGWYYW